MRFLLLAVIGVSSFAFASPRGFAPGPNLLNRALLVGVSHGLPGIVEDVDNVEAMAHHEAYQFETTILREGEGTVSNIADNLTKLSQDAGDTGTLLFYFSGHGSRGSIYVSNRSMRANEIRAAVEEGRSKFGKPVDRLVMMFDSCFSGTLLDPMHSWFPLGPLADRAESEAFAESLAEAFSVDSASGRRAGEYWKSLFVFAACRANETSLAGGNGSVFTNALVKGFNETMAENGTMADMVSKTQEYTKGHHPVARFAPESLQTEKMRP